MKKLLLLCAALLLLATLVACGGDDHTEHVFGEWRITTPATCVSEGVETRTCSCGETETRPVAATGVHVYGTDNTCTACGERLAFTDGLVLTSIENGAAYAVTHVGTSATERIVLPAYHEGKPVTALLGLLVDAEGTVSAQRITSVELSAKITYVDPKAFEGCTVLSTLTVAAGNTVYHAMNSCLIQTAEKLLVAGCVASTVPSDGSVTAIGSHAFYKNTALTSFTVPHCVTAIAPGAFLGCSNLTSVVIKSTDATSDPTQPNPLQDSWSVSESADGSGLTVSVDDAAQTATLLTDTYRTYYWKRTASGDSVRY